MKKLSRLATLLLAVAVFISGSICAYADNIDSIGEIIGSALSDEFGDEIYYDNSNADKYTIDSYDVDIVVNENNTLSVTEKITADFNVPKHGIYRYIPVVGNVKRVDGSEATFRTRVSHVSSDMPIYDTYRDGNNYVIQLGEENTTLKGKNSYEISYTYSIGKDMVDGADELYYNIIGTGWDTTLDNISFKISMPKEFDASKIGFSTGRYGAEGTDIVKFKVKGNTIKGRLTKGLKAYEGLTMRIELEDGYFKFNWLTFYFRYIAQIGVCVIALMLVIILWVKYGRDKKIVEVVEFYPPEGLNCAEVSYWHNGVVTPEDTVPLLIELANEGYLSIEEIEGRGLLKKDSFRLTKSREYDGDDGLKKMFFNGLFKRGSSVTEKDLTNRFYVTINAIVKGIQEENRTSVFNRKSLLLRIAGWAVSVVAFAINLVIFAYTSYGTRQDFIMLLIGGAIALASFGFAFFIRQRTDEGHEMKQKIEGFKRFLETAEKGRLEALVEENPSYFYDVLPYAYVLGVSDKWTRKFEKIAMEPPQWYYSTHTTAWDYMLFNHFMRSTMTSATKSFVSTPQSNSSGGGISSGGSFSGGGGFSGGGFGGGGGGSW